MKILDRLPSLLSGGPAPETAVTPYRKASLVFDFPEPQIQRAPFTLYREGSDLNPSYTADLGTSENVMLLPSGWWALTPAQIKYDFERVEPQAGIIRQSGGPATPQPNVGLFETAPGWTEHPMWRKPSELPGLIFDPAAVDVGDYFLIKGVTAAGSWATSMPYGPGADTPPPLGGTMVQMHRAAVGDTTHEENAGYSVRIQVPAHLAGSPDVVAQMTFGGPTPTWDRRGNSMTSDQAGGQHAIAFHGNGETTLSEWIAGAWTKVFTGGHSFFADIGRKMIHWIGMPQGPTRFNMFAAGTKATHAANPVAAATPHPRALPQTQVVYRPNPITTGRTRSPPATRGRHTPRGRGR
jgi:hypothetical protein